MHAGQALHLHPHIVIAQELQHFLQQGERLPVADPDLPGFRRGQQRDRADAGKIGVVVHHDRAVPGRMDVELDSIGVQHDRPAEGGA